MSERTAEQEQRAVECRLYVDGKVIEFRIPGPLVALRPAPAKARKGKESR
jgi:hypothetical protein